MNGLATKLVQVLEEYEVAENNRLQRGPKDHLTLKTVRTRATSKHPRVEIYIPTKLRENLSPRFRSKKYLYVNAPGAFTGNRHGGNVDFVDFLQDRLKFWNLDKGFSAKVKELNDGFLQMQMRPRTIHPIAGELVDMWNNYENAEELHEVDEQEVDEQEDSSPEIVPVPDKAQNQKRFKRHMAKVRKTEKKEEEAE